VQLSSYYGSGRFTELVEIGDTYNECHVYCFINFYQALSFAVMIYSKPSVVKIISKTMQYIHQTILRKKVNKPQY